MSLQSGVSLGQLLLSIGGTLVVISVAWGGLLQRVKALERDVDALKQALPAIQVSMATLVANTNALKEGLAEIKRSWVFVTPPQHTAVNPRNPLD